jgi:hypothetical protein
MAKESVEWDDKAFRAALTTALHSIKDSSATAIYRTGMRVVNATKRLASVDTGRLRSSYLSKPGMDSRGPYALVGSTVDYAGYVEFGTMYQSAQPHFRPGLLSAVEAWAQEAAQIKPRI